MKRLLKSAGIILPMLLASHTLAQTDYVLTEHLLQSWDDSAWSNLARHGYAADSSGHTVRDSYYVRSDDSWMFRNLTTYSYDGDGRRTAEKLVQDTVILSTMAYTYENGRLSVQEYRIEDANHQKWEYSYNAAGQLTGRETFTWVSGSRWELSAGETYMYDDDGNCTRMLSQVGGINFGRHSVTYNADGTETTELYEDWAESTWVNEYDITHDYDPTGVHIRRTTQRWQDGAWTFDSKTEFHYDGHGNETVAYSCRRVDDAWVYVTLIIRTYKPVTVGVYRDEPHVGDTRKQPLSVTYYGLDGHRVTRHGMGRGVYVQYGPDGVLRKRMVVE